MGKKKKTSGTASVPAAAPTAPASPRERRVFWILLLAAFALGAFLRFYDLERKPLHHDEGVNSFFLLNLKNDFPQGWKYDPENYHGPFLFLVESIPLAFSESPFAMRLLVAICGSGTMLALWPLRRRIGYAGTAAAALLLAVSTSNIFFSRTNIHEIYLVFFTLGMVVAAARLRESLRPVYLLLAAGSWALVIANKETYVMTGAAFVGSLGIAWYFLRKPRAGEVAPSRVAAQMLEWINSRRVWLWWALGVFVFLIALFYSSLFTNLKGTTADLINSLLIWKKTGTKGAGHEKEFAYFFQLLWRLELPIYLLGIAGIVWAFIRRNAFMIFTAAWAVLLTLIYSSVPYKTPWLALNFILPLALLGGYFLENVYQAVKKSPAALSAAGAVFAAVLIGWLIKTSWLVNFEEYDDDRHMIVYSQTRRDYKYMVEAIEKYAKEKGQGIQTKVNVITDEYWPLNWDLRNYKGAAFWGRVIPDPDAPIIVGRTKTQAELESKLKDTYESEMYSLRPGVDLILYLRTKMGSDAREQLKGDAVADLDPAKLSEGLLASYYNKISPVGKPAHTRVETRVYFQCNSDAEKIAVLGLKAPLSIVWEGYLEASADGLYRFATESDDGSWVYLDEKMVVDNGGEHGNQYASGDIELTKGYHRFKVRYFDSAWGAWMKLLWTPPGGGEIEIPASHLRHLP